MNDLILFAVTAAAFTWHITKRGVGASKSSDADTCDATSSLRNSAFVFVKPHANTLAVQNLVRQKLLEQGCTIRSEMDIDGPTIDSKKLIDQHYYAIASKATILSAKDIPVPVDVFATKFGESWDTVLAENRACNAMEACARFDCTAEELNTAWGASANVVKLGGGFYCGLVTIGNVSLYVFNAFFMTMRSKFVGPTDSIHCFDIEWSPTNKLSWSDFRNVVLGPTDPAEAPVGSLRRTIYDNYQSLGLSSIPNKGDNGVHASASPFEGLAEKMNWLSRSLSDDPFGQALLSTGLSSQTIMDWSVDPQVIIDASGNKKGSIFDALEDMDAPQCLAKLVELNDWNTKK